jgi:hypothetical protein
MIPVVDNVHMIAFLLLAGLIAVCVLAGFFGADSRHDEPGRHRTNLL